MDRRMIWIFLLAVNFSHIEPAARKIGVNRSTVDRSLKKLAKMINVDLYKPNGNLIELTERGHQAHNMLLLLDADYDRLLRLFNGQTITFGFTDDRNTQLLIDTVESFRDTRPEIYSEYFVASRKKLVGRLRDEALDFLICSDFEFTDKSFEFFDFTIEYKLAVPVNHPLASRSYITPDDLKCASLILPLYYNEITEWAGDPTVTSKNRTNNFFNALLLMNRGMGCAFIPEPCASILNPNAFKLIQLYPKLTMNLRIVARKNIYVKSAAYEFKQYLKSLHNGSI